MHSPKDCKAFEMPVRGPFIRLSVYSSSSCLYVKGRDLQQKYKLDNLDNSSRLVVSGYLECVTFLIVSLFLFCVSFNSTVNYDERNKHVSRRG